MEIFVSAGETSSDIHCARLVQELKNTDIGPKLKTFGLGGDALEAQGTSLFMHNREFSIAGGPIEMLSKLPKRRKLEKLLEKYLYVKRPDAAILVDNGEINLRLASILHLFGVPVVYYIPPKIWVWRFSRMEKMAKHVSLVLSILPFEAPLYQAWEVPFQYVGNPLIDEVPLALTNQEAKQKLGLSPDTPVLTILPGSRPTEVKLQVPLFSTAIQKFLKKLKETTNISPQIIIPVAPTIELDAINTLFKQYLPQVKCIKTTTDSFQTSHLCLKAADAALVKSGTSTLEAALLGTPMVLAYHASRSAEWVYKHVVRYKGYVGLVNLFLEKNAEAALGWEDTRPNPTVPEFILEKCTPENIATELLEIYKPGTKRETMSKALLNIKTLLQPPQALGASPTQAAANAIIKLLRSKNVV